MVVVLHTCAHTKRESVNKRSLGGKVYLNTWYMEGSLARALGYALSR